jgi:hypothetical protein
LVLDRSILDLLSITADTPLRVTTNGRGLTITPVEEEITRAEFDESLNRIHAKYGRMFKRLAE